MLVSLEMARQSFLDVCISAGLEVLARGMEAGDRGPRHLVQAPRPGLITANLLNTGNAEHPELTAPKGVKI